MLEVAISRAPTSKRRTEEAQEHPLARHRPNAIESMRFVRLEALLQLEAPLPRCQDLPEEAFGVMNASDKLVAISHGWRFQMHPDPYGTEIEPMGALLRRIRARCDVGGSEVFVFLDFLAIPQRPFDPGQAERTPEEERTFRAALTHLDAVFLYADYLVHLDLPVAMPLGEGEVFTTRQSADDKWAFREVGSIVQCTATCAYSSVRAVNGVPAWNVKGVEQALDSGDGAELTLERHRYGLPNTIPPSERGWIYLERFITMVVAAMVQETAFQDTVFANEAGLLREIHAGAECLRLAAARAAHQDSGRPTPSAAVGSPSLPHGTLASVFRCFEERLECKRFSAASVDKVLDPALRSANSPSDAAAPAALSDAEIVADIMRTLVAHLGMHWQVLEARRLRRSDRIEKLRTYVVHWSSFSPAYVERIQEGMRLDLLYTMQLFMQPLLLMLVPLLLPYRSPDAGWVDNWMHVLVGNNWIALMCFIFVPQWIQLALGFSMPWTCTVLWPIMTTLVVNAVCPVSLSSFTGFYPFPFTPLVDSITYFGCLPALWYLLPASARTRRAKGKFARAVAAQVLLTAIFCSGYPLLNVGIEKATHVWQTLLYGMIFLGARLMFEKGFNVLLNDLGPDVQPAMFFTAELAYQTALCDFFRNAQDWSIFIVFVSADVLENLYYLYCFVQHYPRGRRPRGALCGPFSPPCFAESSCESGSETSDCSSDASGDEPDVLDGGFCDGGAATVAAVLLLRELADVLAPAISVASFIVLYYTPARRFNGWVADLGPEEFGRAMGNLVTALVVEIIIAALTGVALWSRGLKPLCFLRGVMVGSSRAFFPIAATTTMSWFAALQLAHSGCDFSFRLLWVTGNATWEGGELWSAPG